MDIRAKRSRDKIIDTFLKLRAKKKLEKITVTEICKKADINKSTFYAHFHDIYDLSDVLETQLVEEIVSKVHPPKNGEFTKEFTIGIFNEYIANRKRIEVLFSDSRSVFLPRKIADSIRGYIFNLHPELSDDPEFNIQLTYSIYGGFYTYADNLHYGVDTILNVISEMNVFDE